MPIENIKLEVNPLWYENPEDDEGRPIYTHNERKEIILNDIADIMTNSGKVANASKLRAYLLGNGFSCAIGCGVAIPHARCMQTKSLVMGFARCVQGVDFNAPDDEKVQIFI